ncbi:type I restriction-modification enzyme R subunit C-terminal domain-containing protein [Chroococcus sp. FPU101]|uniref:type I restriction endonuclease subunit R n=1 Tax=Chroococcus sp. FPU101 TaxID=1974212 RepID=UPI001A8C6A7A|nr:type I restriction-modification enzyme R subunit C-terminal domain-containing protein [Chroococcus sp. FPU101]GFE69213.1 type I restriction enzyme EcoKI subunit R [Chroococcus sp. FPU101]
MSSANQTPENQARDLIDQKLAQAGWDVQDKNAINFNASLGIAVREYQTDAGYVDYALFVDRKPVGIIEAKRDEEGHRLTVVEEQSREYADSKLKHINNQPLPFIYESTGKLTRFTDRRDPKPRSRLVFSFHRPETFQEWLTQSKSLRDRLPDIPTLDPTGLRNCQVIAINNLEKSFKRNLPRALVQMATGSGKTFTAITAVYRLLKFADAKRVLFLVDTKNLGEQAEQEFMSFVPNDDNRKFTELYNVQRLSSNYLAKDAQVCISTIQRLYSILKGSPLDEAAEETNPNEMVQRKQPVPVAYNPRVPIEFFDFIIIDECHRSIYNIWQQVLDYFDAFLIGLTATPDLRTFGFFNENIVSEYTHEQAVMDGVNVGYEVYTIETEITKNGSRLIAQEFIEKREKLTREKRWTQIDDEIVYAGTQLDRDVVNPSQIRQIIRTFRDKLPEIFPHRQEVPKTLIFAKDDSHADDIINMVREEFDEGNDFCKKVTYKAKEDPKSVLSQFRNGYNPRIAVTVDMIATGTDVRPLECLIFMRDVKSRNYYEQMKGRGTRTLSHDELKKVSGSAPSAKTHFVIIDAVGVEKSVKTDSRPLETKRSVPLKDLMQGIMMGATDTEAYTSLAGRLARLERQVTSEEAQEVQNLTQGAKLGDIAQALLNACDLDVIEDRAKQDYQTDNPTLEQLEAIHESLSRHVSGLFTGQLIEYLDNVRQVHEQYIDSLNLDKVTYAGWSQEQQTQNETLITDFKAFIEVNKDEITALRIYYNLPYQQRPVTYQMVKEVLDILKKDRPHLAPLRIWQAYAQIEQVSSQPINELTALVTLIRRVIGLDETLTPHENRINRAFQTWVFQKQAGASVKFNEEQMQWLRAMKEHIISSFALEREDLDYAPFDSMGGLGKLYQLFGDEMEAIIEELNTALVV